MSATRYTQSNNSLTTCSKWSNLNLDLYSADSKVRDEKMATNDVAGFAYINASGRAHYAFVPYPIYEPETGEVACIMENASDCLDELEPIEIGGEALQYVMNIVKKM